MVGGSGVLNMELKDSQSDRQTGQGKGGLLRGVIDGVNERQMEPRDSTNAIQCK